MANKSREACPPLGDVEVEEEDIGREDTELTSSLDIIAYGSAGEEEEGKKRDLPVRSRTNKERSPPEHSHSRTKHQVDGR